MGGTPPGVSDGRRRCAGACRPSARRRRSASSSRSRFCACWSAAAIAASTSGELMSASIFSVSKPGIESPTERSSSSVTQPLFSRALVPVEQVERLPEVALQAGGVDGAERLLGVGPDEVHPGEDELDLARADVLLDERRQRVHRVVAAVRALRGRRTRSSSPVRVRVAELRSALRDALEERPTSRRRREPSAPARPWCRCRRRARPAASLGCRRRRPCRSTGAEDADEDQDDGERPRRCHGDERRTGPCGYAAFIVRGRSG